MIWLRAGHSSVGAMVGVVVGGLDVGFNDGCIVGNEEGSMVGLAVVG
jgi:hypothetical protein